MGVHIHAVDDVLGHRTKLTCDEEIVSCVESADKRVHPGLVGVVIANEALALAMVDPLEYFELPYFQGNG